MQRLSGVFKGMQFVLWLCKAVHVAHNAGSNGCNVCIFLIASMLPTFNLRLTKNKLTWWTPGVRFTKRFRRVFPVYRYKNNPFNSFVRRTSGHCRLHVHMYYIDYTHTLETFWTEMFTVKMTYLLY